MGEWDTLGTIALPLDDGLTPDRTLRYGDIRLEVLLPTEAVSTLAGQAGEWGYADGPGTEARFGQHGESSIDGVGLAAAPDGSVIVADLANGAVRRVATDGAVTTIAGGNRGRLFMPRDVAVDAEGSIYVAGAWPGSLIRKFSSDGRVTSVVAGGGPEGAPFEIPPDGPAEEAYFGQCQGDRAGPGGRPLRYGAVPDQTDLAIGVGHAPRWREVGLAIATARGRRPSSPGCTTSRWTMRVTST